MKFSRKSLLSILLAACITAGALAIAPHAFAQVVDPTLTNGGLSSFAEQAGLSTGQGLTVTIARLIRTAISFLGILAVVFVLYGGFRYMTSGGNDDKVKSAKKIFSSAIVGLVIILSAFAIVQFILGQLTGALGDSNSSSDDGTDGYDDSDSGRTPGTFLLDSVNTECASAVRNLKLQLTFSSSASLTTVNAGGIVVRKSSESAAVPGTFASEPGKAITFVPSDDCGDGSSAHCFESGVSYTIDLNAAILKSSDDSTFRCDTDVDHPCSYSFVPGTGIDLAAPTEMTLSAPSRDGESAYEAVTFPLQSHAVDDTGVSSSYFTVDNDTDSALAAVMANAFGPANDFDSEDGEWFVPSDFATGSHSIRAIGSDCAGNAKTSDAVSVEVYPYSCQDAETNNGEEALNCGGTSECGACSGSPCTLNSQCASGYCAIDPTTGEGVCASIPEITAVSPGDGAVGNLITIKGSGFLADGDAAGTVTFLGGAGTDDDVVVSDYQCDGSSQWTDREIVIQVPTDSALADGPIMVTTGGTPAYTDSTDDAFGAVIGDFQVNNVVRPGLCLLATASGVGQSDVPLSGNNFGDSQGSSTVYFGNYEASDYNRTWSDTGLNVQVPLLNAGSYDTQVWTGDFQCALKTGELQGKTCPDGTGCDADGGYSCMESRCSMSDAYCATDADCGETGGTCVSLRQGSNAVPFAVTDASADTTPVIASIISGWMACSNHSTTHCSVDADCSDEAYSPTTGTCETHDDWGPIGQYLTINGTGFGSTAGTVSFTNENSASAEDGFVAWGDKDFPPACGSGTWTDTEIIVKVPRFYNDNGGINAVVGDTAHALAVSTGTSGKTSDAKDFFVPDDAPGPGVCDVTPSSGPVGTPVTFSGDNFESGSTPAAPTVTFSGSTATASTGWTTDATDGDTATASVPSGSETGPAIVTNSTRGYASNGMNFQVGSCTDGTVSCPTDETCCSNGACAAAASCPVPVEDSHYSWYFSTGKIPKAPKVLVDCSVNDVASPSPWNSWSKSENICVNAVVTATFDMDMDTSSLPANVLVTASDGTVVVEGDVSLSASQRMFEWIPSGGTFLPNTTYTVTLSAAGIKSSEGTAMARDYSWSFTTSPSSDLCVIGSVYTGISPQTATEKDTPTIPFSAQPISSDDFCVRLDCKNYAWAWSSDDVNLASVDPSANAASTTSDCSTYARPLVETPSNDPVQIEARTTNPDGVPVFDPADLFINFTDPEVVSFVPSCDEACVNAAIAVTFNTAMSSDLSTSTVKVYSCADSLCASDEAVVWASSAYTVSQSMDDSGESVPTGIIVGHTAPFAANTWYRVVISGDVTSESGVSLKESGSNYPSDDNAFYADAFSWKFKTKDSSEACAVDRVETNPSAASATVIGERTLWQAVPYGAPDACSVVGQELDASGYAWDAWTARDAAANANRVSDSDVASMVSPLALTSVLPNGCSDSCLRSGSDATRGDALCGNGVRDYGEECDDGDSSDTSPDGSPDACSSTCLNQGSSADYRVPSVCGDGAVGMGEECDDGDIDDTDGCSSICLNNGSKKAGTTCGDGTVDQSASFGGEDCDDSNAVSGDGCSSDCLYEGGTARSDVYSVCGNSIVEDGEDCDVGDLADGDGCSSSCLYEGASACAYACTGADHKSCQGIGAACWNSDGSSDGTCLPVSVPCCGDSRIDYTAIGTPRSEDCDDGNAADGDGCSSSCLNEGSSLSLASYCGDGTVSHTTTNGGSPTGGEECDASAAPDSHYGFWGVSTINATAALDVNATTRQAESTITATENTLGVTVEGSGSLTLTCSCVTDLSCNVSSADSTNGCGTSGCCFPRPTLLDQSPAGGTDICRNTAIYADFSDVMNPESFSSWTDANGNGVLDAGEGTQNLYLQLAYLNGDSTTGTAEPEDGNCPSSAYTKMQIAFVDASSRSWIASAWNWIVDSAMRLLGGSANAQMTSTPQYACLIPVTYALTPNSSGGSRVALIAPDALEPNSTYNLVVIEDADLTDAVDGLNDGVLSANAVSVAATGTGSVSTTFTTGTKICSLDAVTVEDLGVTPSGDTVDPSVGYFTSLGETHAFVAVGSTIQGGERQEIVSTPSYGWTWSWGTTGTTGSTPTDIVSASDDHTAASTVTAAGKTGQGTVEATAAIFGTSTDPVASGYVSGTTLVTANMCDNPSAIGDAQGLYVDDASNFSFYYCKDFGTAGDASDDLPDLEAPIVVATSSFISEKIFKVSGESDAIGVRVLPNASSGYGFCSTSTTLSCSSDASCPSGETCDLAAYMTPSAWYSAQGFTGSPSATTVDGYEAVQYGNTVYVAATNVKNGTIYPNIYVISYTAGASSGSQEIFRQILASWSFNANGVASSSNSSAVTDINLCRVGTGYPVDSTSNALVSCVWDADCSAYSTSTETAFCDADKAKLVRDMRRLEDVTSVAGTLDAYGAAYGFCSATTNQACTSDSSCPGNETCEASVPKLADGTFVSSFSVSTWPSWVSGLGNALGSALPTDPLNEFFSCENVCVGSLCSLSGNACSADVPCGEFESATCWNSTEAEFVCPDDSHVYGYQSVGGTSFKLSTQLEYDAGVWAYQLSPSRLGTVTAEYDHALSGSETFPDNFVFHSSAEAFCKGGTLGTSAVCGDGVIGTGSGEVCEVGDIVSGNMACDTDSDGVGDGAICSDDGGCATGILCKAISCDDGSGGVTGGIISTKCYYTGSDPDNDCKRYKTVTESEALTTDVPPGDGAACSSYSCGNGVTETGEDCDDGAANGTYGHCGDGCLLSTAFSCGDGYLAGGEQCDCGEVSNFSAVMEDSGSWAYSNCTTVSNGQWKRTPANTCSFDCKSPGPSCGDGETNGNEVCDGDFQSWAGALCADGTECTTSDDCTDGSACGDGAGTAAPDGDAACGSGTVCETDGNADGITDNDAGKRCGDTDGDASTPVVRCEAKVLNDAFQTIEYGACGTVTYDLTRSRTCVTSGSSMCSWGDGWTECVSADYCGNGTVDGTEQCDDGNEDNTDACTDACVSNACGDGYVYSGVESCDDGSANGGTCEATYEGQCHYCTSNCQYKTRSGDYCGDGVINGTEYCDGADHLDYYYDKTDTGYDRSSTTCAASEEGTEATLTDSGSTYTCRYLGVCDGGDHNGEPCTLHSNGSAYTNGGHSSADDNLASCGTAADGTAYTCVAPTCDASCSTSCPFGFQSVSVLGQTEESGSTQSDSIDLYSYLSGFSPDNAVLYVPACSVGTQITADVDSTTNVTAPNVDIVFLTDFTITMGDWVDGGYHCDGNGTTSAGTDCSGSTDTSCGTDGACSREAPLGNRRIDYVTTATKDAIASIFSQIQAGGGTPRGSLVRFYGRNTSSSSSSSNLISVDVPMTADQDELEDAIDLYPDTPLENQTPTFSAIANALGLFDEGATTAEKQILILLSDGVPTIDSSGTGYCSDDSGLLLQDGVTYASSGSVFCIDEIASELLPTLSTEHNIDTKIFTAAITNGASAKGYMAHISSDACGVDYGEVSDCAPDALNIEYAYQAEDAAGITAMYDNIVSTITGISTTLTTDADGDGTSTESIGTMANGNNQLLPFPSDFACTGSDMTIPLRISFSGDGYVTLDNMIFTYCPVQ